MPETSTEYFDERWASSADPWDHAGRWYETRKYDLTVAALPCPRSRHAVEPACGVGLLTVRLAGRADHVTANDRFTRAVDEAAGRCAELANVSVSVADIRDGPPGVPYDLAVISEVLYYFDATTVVEVLRHWHAGCTPGGHVVLVHHRPEVDEHVLTGDDVHAIAADLLGSPVVQHVDELFRLDVHAAPSRPAGPSST
jgi:protein-L-isoaspartate O-methyltransferase